MKQLTRYLTLIFAVCLIPASSAFADKDDKDDKDKKERQGESSAVLRTSGSGPDPGQCTLGLAQKDLDVNNVRARLFNFGSIGYGNGAEAQYIAPKASGNSPIYAMGVWMGGMVGDELRTAAATYINFEFWPGPLGSDGRPVNPNDCSAYDRLYKVSRSDVQNYEATGQAASDLADWPYDLGAPVIDGDGTEGNYNLAGGDRPDLIGDQAVWWIMNDVGNTHRNTQAAPIGVEVRVHAFAFNRADALGNTTFYKYNVTYKGDEPLTDTYFSIFSDPDLGDAADDFVGVDTTLSLGYVYNDNRDGRCIRSGSCGGLRLLPGAYLRGRRYAGRHQFHVFHQRWSRGYGGPASFSGGIQRTAGFLERSTAAYSQWDWFSDGRTILPSLPIRAIR